MIAFSGFFIITGTIWVFAPEAYKADSFLLTTIIVTEKPRYDKYVWYLGAKMKI